MINVIVFIIHALFIIYIFRRFYKTESMADALLNVALIIILFTVGISIVDTVMKLFIESRGFGEELERDTLSLIVLSICEAVFYKYYYFRNKTATANGKGK